MSVSGPHNGFAGSIKSYPPGSGGPARSPLPTLPPMSSLLRHENPTAEGHQNNPFTARQFQPPYNMTKQPNWAGQISPGPSLQHGYHQPNSPVSQHSSQSPTPPLPGPQTQHTLAVLDGNTPSGQRRQIKKIVQRRASPPKDYKQDDKKTASPPVNGKEDTNRSSRQPETRTYSRPGSGASSSTTPQLSTQNSSMRALPISGLLSDGPNPAPIRRAPKYSIRMRQEPLAARACGFGERDRRVIDPPPILQMDVEDPTASPEELRALIRQPYAVVHCVLWDPESNRDDTAMPGTTDKRQQRRLMGTLVASPFVGKDELNNEGCFFTFPDLSVRTPGKYSLKFSLVVLDVTRMRPDHSEPVRCNVWSSEFNVFNAKDFGGMRASTELTKTLKQQGCLISVKKGNTKAGGAHPRDEDDDDEEDDGDDESMGSAPKRGKKTKR